MSSTKNGGHDSANLSPQNESHSDCEKDKKGPKPKKRSVKEIKAQQTESVTSKDGGDSSKANASEDDGSHSSVEKSPKVLPFLIKFIFTWSTVVHNLPKI